MEHARLQAWTLKPVVLDGMVVTPSTSLSLEAK
jgi:hypothetical protein